MKRLSLLLLLAAVPAFAASTVTHDGPVTVTKTPAPKKELRFDVVIPAPREAVWQAFTTSEGLDTWLWKDCTVDLRPGGEWMVHYTADKSGGGTIERFRPGREITLHAMAPEQFPTVRAIGTTAVFRFDEAGKAATRVRLIQTGWKDDAEWDQAYDYLARGNAQLLRQLHHRFTNGPIDWEAKR